MATGVVVHFSRNDSEDDASSFSKLATAAAHARTRTYYASQQPPVVCLEEDFCGTAAEEDLHVHVTHHIACRMRDPAHTCATFASGAYSADYGATCWHWGIDATKFAVANSKAPAFACANELMPLFDDMSPLFPSFQKGEVVILAPAGAGTLRDTGRLSLFLQSMHKAGHAIGRFNSLTSTLCQRLVQRVADVVRCIMIVLPSNAWIHEVPAVIAALRSTATLAPVHVCLLLFCGQRLEDTAAKLCPLASMIISSISPGRSKDGQLQVCMPAWLDAPGDVLDVVAQLDGSLRKGCHTWLWT
jgi:hypothetical protein